MKTLILEQAAAALSASSRTAILLLTLGMDFGEMDGLMVRDLADLRPIITNDTFQSLCDHQSVMMVAETISDFDDVTWAADALERIIPSSKAPVTALYFADGTLTRIISSVNYSVPSGIPVADGARQAA